MICSPRKNDRQDWSDAFVDKNIDGSSPWKGELDAREDDLFIVGFYCCTSTTPVELLIRINKL